MKPKSLQNLVSKRGTVVEFFLSASEPVRVVGMRKEQACGSLRCGRGKVGKALYLPAVHYGPQHPVPETTKDGRDSTGLRAWT